MATEKGLVLIAKRAKKRVKKRMKMMMNFNLIQVYQILGILLLNLVLRPAQGEDGKGKEKRKG